MQLNGNVQPLLNGYGDFRDGSGQPLAAGLTNAQFNYANQEYRLNIWTTGDKGGTGLPNVNPPGQSPGFQFITVPVGGPGSLNILNGAATSGLALDPSAGLSVGSASGDAVTTTIESESRRKVESDLNGEQMPSDEASCPGGAGDLADMGDTRSVDGVAPDVFARCRDAG